VDLIQFVEKLRDLSEREHNEGNLKQMIKRRFFIIILVLVLGMLLVSCTSSSTAANSWPAVTVSGDSVYFANGTMVYSLRSNNGNLSWQYPEKATAKRLFFAHPLVIGDQVLLADYDNKLASLKTIDGSENWIFSGAKGRYIASPIVVNDLIIASNADYSVYALDLQGNLKWKFTGGHAFWTKPVSDGKTIYAACMDHYLYAIDLESGSLVWKSALGAALVSNPLLDENGTVYLGDLDGNFYAVSASDGSKIWEQKVGGGVWAQPILHDGMLYFGDQSGRINILSATDGKSTQYIETDGAVLGKGAELSEGIVFGSENGEILMIGFDGSKVWTRTVEGNVYADLVFDGNQIYVAANNSTKPLVAMDGNGNENWSFSVKK
jgi:outer membrane protein assembly factor BamB